jgi:hypothetical protein
MLLLPQWVVARPRDAKCRRGEYAELDPGWGWTRKAIGQLLEEGLKAKEATIPPELREMVRSVLRPPADDPDPTPEAATDMVHKLGSMGYLEYRDLVPRK